MILNEKKMNIKEIYMLDESGCAATKQENERAV
jgi:hypothetical protein